MLSQYHLQFIEHLSAGAIPYLVVGGQARRLCRGRPGHDLDLWIGYSAAARPVILRAMLEWGREHPAHVQDDFAHALPLALQDGFQLKFPVWDGVLYLVADEVQSVSIADGIDVLIGGGSTISFETCIARAVIVDCNGIKVPCLHPDDDRAFPRLGRVTVNTAGIAHDR